jgi:hypothetical protein
MKKYLLLLTILFIKCGQPPVEIWPAGEIPYCYTSSFTSSEKAIIEYSMTSWERESNIKFIETKCDVRVVLISKSKSNCATLGYREFPILQLTNITLFVVEHELGHIIGLPHEHQRPDRDNFVVIHWENIIPEYYDQFEISPESDWAYDYTRYPYDYNSIMHYDSFAFSANGGETIETNGRQTWNYDITDTDYAKVKDMYTADVYED